jgi:NAD(P)-dependent dehydrogenase (short-subunit alcohol dehydrogenase family)
MSRVALVTGSSGGIGAAICKRLETDGFDVLGVDLRVGESSASVSADLATPEGNRAAIDAALERFGRLDVVVAAAGFRQLEDEAKAHKTSPERVLEDVVLAPHAIKRLIEPEEVADVVSFLVGPGGRTFTGAAVTMDMGWTAR